MESIGGRELREYASRYLARVAGYIRLDISADAGSSATPRPPATWWTPGGRGHQRLRDCLVHELSTGITRRVSLNIRNRASARGGVHPALSADGRIVAFHSLAPNLVLGDSNRVLS